MKPNIQQEFNTRMEMWQELLDAGGPVGVSPQLLRDLGIYGGAQGIWVNKTRTGELSEDGEGITVGVLHTGSSYADDMSQESVIYHYPKTGRPPGRDLSEVNATKAARELGLPIFVIAYPTPNSAKRDAHLAWIQDWDDESRQFLIALGSSPPAELPLPDAADTAPFATDEKRKRGEALVATRPGQAKFNFRVFQRYGPQCAVCGIDIPELLDSAHLIPISENGNDDARNGLVLCAIHHRAFDAVLFAFNPESLSLQTRKNGPDLDKLRIKYTSLQHLRKKPHPSAIEWRWHKWAKANETELTV
jgi:hypothetical protein